jgi:hypothetical protein
VSCADIPHMHDDSADEVFDVKTFQLLLCSHELEQRQLARSIKTKLERLARLRAWDEGIVFAEAWAGIFDIGRMRADVLGRDDYRASLASKVWDDLVDLQDRYEDAVASMRRHRRCDLPIAGSHSDCEPS